MEKQKLITFLGKFLDEELSVDLYFVFKDEGFYTQYKTDPDDKLRQELITAFSSELSRYADNTNPYPLTDIYDDNENEEYHLYYDQISKNRIAGEVFNFDKVNVKNYSPAVGSLSRIYGFLIELSDGANFVTIYKRNQATHAINPKKAINFFTGIDNKFKLLEQNATHISKTIDLFKIENIILINSRAVYESQFGFIAELKTKATDGYLELVATNAFEFSQKVNDKIPNLQKSHLKKLAHSITNNPIIQKGDYSVIIRQAKKYLKHTFSLNSAGQIEIKTIKEMNFLIDILNRDYNHNEITKERFLTKNKKPL